MKDNFIYVVCLDWQDDEYSDSEIEAFTTYEKALKRFNEVIAEEKTEMPWINESFGDDGLPLPDSIFSEFSYLNYDIEEKYWVITSKDDPRFSDCVSLRAIPLE